MINLFFQSGMFGWLMLLCTLSAAVFTLVSLKVIFDNNNASTERIKDFINMIVRSGVLAAVIGFNGTIFGGYQAIWEIKGASEISMAVVLEGVNIALSSTILGLTIFTVSALLWFVLRMRVLLKMS